MFSLLITLLIFINLFLQRLPWSFLIILHLVNLAILMLIFILVRWRHITKLILVCRSLFNSSTSAVYFNLLLLLWLLLLNYQLFDFLRVIRDPLGRLIFLWLLKLIRLFLFFHLFFIVLHWSGVVVCFLVVCLTWIFQVLWQDLVLIGNFRVLLCFIAVILFLRLLVMRVQEV